jgi:hypothetical protein
MIEEVMDSSSYYEALSIMQKYVEFDMGSAQEKEEKCQMKKKS